MSVIKILGQRRSIGVKKSGGSLAEFELELIRERVTAGMERARKEGKAIGRPKIADDPQKAQRLHEAVTSVQSGTLSYRQAAATYRVSVSSIQRGIKEIEEAQTNQTTRPVFVSE